MKKLLMILLCAFTMTMVSCKKEKIEPVKETSSESTSSGQGCSSVQCSATAVSTGQRCKRMTTNCNGRCYQHQ